MLEVCVVVSLVLTSLLQGGSSQPGDPCPSVIDKPGCVCNHPDGLGIIDVTGLARKGALAPRWIVVVVFIILLQ